MSFFIAAITYSVAFLIVSTISVLFMTNVEFSVVGSVMLIVESIISEVDTLL